MLLRHSRLGSYKDIVRESALREVSIEQFCVSEMETINAITKQLAARPRVKFTRKHMCVSKS